MTPALTDHTAAAQTLSEPWRCLLVQYFRSMPQGVNAENKPLRRTQEQRSAATRRQILDAAVQCLQAYDCAGTTTVRVATLNQRVRGSSPWWRGLSA